MLQYKKGFKGRSQPTQYIPTAYIGGWVGGASPNDPLLKAGRKKMKLYTMKIQPEKLNEYKLKAKSYQIPLATLIKKLLDEHELPEPVQPKIIKTRKADPELVRQLSGIGNNLNQISRRVNQGENLDVAIELRAIEQSLEELLKC
jgi:hypothetical protein